MKKFILPIVFLGGWWLLCGCPQKPERTMVGVPQGEIISDATGISFSLPLKNQRIISLAPSITENIKILKSENYLVGRTDFCKMPVSISSVGTIIDPSVEKIITLKPDLVFATKEGNRPQSVEKLRELGVAVFVFGESNSWVDIKNNFLLCAKLLGKTAEAEIVIKTIENELSQIRTSPDVPVRVLVQLNVTPLISAGRNTFVDDIITYAQGYNIASESALPWPVLSIEEVFRRNPEIIIISDMGNITAQAKQMWLDEKFADISAVKNKKVYVMDSDLLCQPTPVHFITAVRNLREHLK